MATVSLRKAGGSVMVTVPPVYLKQHGLEAGSKVEIQIKGDKMTITPGRNKVTLTDILAAAPAVKDARKLRAEGWDEMPSVGREG